MGGEASRDCYGEPCCQGLSGDRAAGGRVMEMTRPVEQLGAALSSGGGLKRGSEIDVADPQSGGGGRDMLAQQPAGGVHHPIQGWICEADERLVSGISRGRI